MSLTNLEPIKQQILELIQHDPDVKYIFLGWMTDQFVPKTDYRQLLEDLKTMREDSNRRFEEQRQETQKFREDSNRHWDEMRQDMNKRFETVDKRFDVVDQRFESVDKRFDVIDQRFDVIDQRFEVVDQRFDMIEQRLDEIKTEADKHWALVDLTVGRLQTRAGKNLENTVAAVMRFTLRNPDIQAEHIKLRQEIIDTEGLIGPVGRKYEYDILVQNAQYYVIEVKSGASAMKREELERIRDKANLVQQQLALPEVQAVLITLGKTPELMHICQELDLLLIA